LILGLSVSVYKNNIMLIVVSIIISTLIVDTLLVKIYIFTIIESLSGWRTTVFIIIGVVYTVGQYLVLEFIRRKSKEIRLRGQLHLNIIHTIVTIAQYAITTILVSIFLQMIIVSTYNNGMVIVATTISYAIATTLMTILAKRFFSWFKSNRNPVVFLYAVSSMIIAANAGLTLTFVDVLLMQQPSIVSPHPSTVSPAQFLTSLSLTGMLNYAFVISSFLSFVSFWIATVFLLRHYSDRLGLAKYWITLSIPLFYFISQFLPFFLDLFSSFRQSDPILFGIVYTIVFTLSKPVGGILFGIAFWIVARTLPRDSAIRDYLVISAMGIIILFTSNQAIILVTFSYPPFGIATISFMGLSSYLILVGIYSSAISIAQDTKLRQSIKKMAMKESKLLDSIGYAQMEQQLIQNMLTMIKLNQHNMKIETGIETSLNEEDLSNYLKKVLEETKTKKRGTDS
jgi:hypothetical protein